MNEFPELSEAKEICLDTETHDPDLKTKGPGVRRNGCLVGIALATNDGWRKYYPFNHAKGKQYDKEVVLRYLKDQLCSSNQPKIGANIIYDLDYLEEAGVKVQGPFHDVLLAEPLIDENQFRYNLDSVAKKHLGEGKDEQGMDDYAHAHGWKGKSVQHLWRMPGNVVAPYAEADVDRTIRTYEAQKEPLSRDNLETVYDVERKLIPLLLHMRRTGVRVNVSETKRLYKQSTDRVEELVRKIRKISGVHIDLWAARSLAKAFDKLGLKYPRTVKKNEPSFTATWLERHGHPVAGLIREARKLDKFAGTFLKGQILELAINGRLHPQFNQLRSDDYGTVTGRFSGSLPNLQFIPARDPVLGPATRSLFLPEPGHYWGRADYSQIEIRILAHYAMGMGGNEIRQAFINDPFLDYHQWGADKCGIDRKRAKTINFGVVYGMGAAALALNLGISIDEATRLLEDYYRKLPFLRKTTQTAMRVAGGRGYVKTILGRRRRFDTWEATDWELSKTEGFRSKDPEGLRERIKDFIRTIRLNTDNPQKTPAMGIRRAFTYKAFNAVDQGTAADVMKKAMLDIWEAGIVEEIPLHLTVHDEVDVSVKKTKRGKEAFREMCQIMADTIPLKVPVVVDSELGPNWGSCKDFEKFISNKVL